MQIQIKVSHSHGAKRSLAALRFAAAMVFLTQGGFACPICAQVEGPITPPASTTQSAPKSTPQAAPQAAARSNLTGTWKLNKDQSDDPRKKMQEAMGNSGGEHGGGGWGGRGRTGGGGHRDGGQDRGRESGGR